MRALTLLLILLLPSPALADGDIGTAIHGSMDPSTCRFARYDGRVGYTNYEVRRLIRCAVRRWPVPGGMTEAVSIAECESHLNPKAGAGSTFLGLYQQHRDYWPGRFRQLAPERFDLKPRALNGRANAIVSVRMAHRGGWSPWSCYA